MLPIDVSVVLPAKNEAANLSSLLHEIVDAMSCCCAEVIVVDDGSSDNTPSLINSLNESLPITCRVISHPYSCGQSTSVYRGVLAARGIWIVTLDADGQNDPADIPRLLNAAQRSQNPHFCVIGHRQKRRDSGWKKLQSKIANTVRRWLLQDDTPDTGCGLKLIPRQTFLMLPYFDHMHRYIPALTKRLGGEVICVPVNHRSRAEGHSNYTAWNRGWAGLIDIMGVRWLMHRNKLHHTVDGVPDDE
ncbi:glycosyltransferase family 2 protein [Aestuariibacter sp. A3R04]|uniref:glycosyltransferase family 2 protein n=1 Tax=Aestuariibacter sp. A3R04 TaxID=2841571 RepID=UPI001C096D14|nr:glycosyltransferase family 2 protein [Aestuariibacter sp. A3R04]MBU3022029.1 glycosyltransferase family 2 protein [Aestuariibacter sp. A3R04]